MTAARADDARAHLSGLLTQALGEVAPGRRDAITLERTKNAAHGDYSCNVALQLAKALRRPPREIAARLIAVLPPSPVLEKAEVAGAGFINLHLERSYKQQAVGRILRAGES